MSNNPLGDWIFGKTGGADIRKYQIGKLRETLHLVMEKSDFYKNHYRGFDPGSIFSFEDFEKLPFLTADDLSVCGRQMLCVSPGEIERIVTLQTSGTAGAPKRVYFTAADQELTTDFFSVGMRCMIDEKDRFMILLPYKTPGSVGDLLGRGLGRIGCVVFPYGFVEDFANACAFVIENSITSLVGSPVQVLKLAEASRMLGMDIKLDSVLLSTDYVPDAIAKRLAAIFKCRVFEHYGMTEMCFGGGVYCEHLLGYHMREADLYFEVISEAGKTLPDGSYGEIVFTTLTRTGMPLVRYRTGDYGRFISQRCKCDARLRLMEKVKRRVGGGVKIGNGWFHICDFDEMLFSCDRVVDYDIALKDGRVCLCIITAEDMIGDAEQRGGPFKRTIRSSE